MNYLQATEPSRIALSLRKESIAIKRVMDSCLDLGACAADQATTLHKCLMAGRAMMLDLIGLPKRPGRPMVDERTVRMIREALPEEILVPEGPEPPPTVPPAPTV